MSPCLPAFALDLCIGDPVWLPHPVQAIGALIRWLEARLYHPADSPRRQRLAGVILLALVGAGAAAAAALLLAAAARLGPRIHFTVAVLLLWLAFATHSLLAHGEAVRRPLAAGDLPAARRALARIVARDTGDLDASATARACIESLAENLVDGCIAPLCFALLGGPVAAWAYKAVSTLDSMVGYRSPRYLYFGWASARCDDVLNYLPARLMLLLMPLAAFLVRPGRADARRAWRMARRDAHLHPSPNSGWPEAAMAGALGLELGGPSRYDGQLLPKPRLNAGARAPAWPDIRRAQRLVLIASALPLLLAVSAASLMRH